MGYTAPRTWVAGEYPTAAIFNQHLRDNFLATFPASAPDVAWSTYTPTLTQSGAVTKTVDYASYMKIGRLVICNVHLTATGAGTGSNAISISTPFTANTAGLMTVGTGVIFDSSANTRFPGIAILASSTTIQFFPSSEANQNGYLGAIIMTAALASADTITAHFAFESTT